MSCDESGDKGPGAAYLAALGTASAASIFLGTLAGLWLDSQVGTRPILTLCGLVLGILCGGLLFWSRIRPFLGEPDTPAHWGPDTYDDDN
ncbi:AtpZ/AtpI family protein [Flexivirga caeni]|uniref:AtpZ/AtpI family protein n=1 Tax=Flexivirga caeni TaxID=2294115 RepID=UPI001C661623|nr:AtpZ/AtpI family protein [Flexivirga caeni]